MKKTLFTFFAFCAITAQAQNNIVIGDMNGDGEITISDITELSETLLGNAPIRRAVINGSYSLEEDYQTKSFTVNGISFKMKLVKGGTFQMGSETYSKPVHSVTISNDYYIGETEVTQSLWYAVIGQKPTTGSNKWTSDKGLGDDYPAYFISWDNCQTFITKLNEATGENFRMPTEAEWEFAARGGNKSLNYSYGGSNTIDEVAWYKDNSSSSCHPVATKKANELGLYDMSGNVWEWCSDWYGTYSADPVTDPTGPESGAFRVTRGGSSGVNSPSCDVAYHAGVKQNYQGNEVGLRLVLCPSK